MSDTPAFITFITQYSVRFQRHWPFGEVNISAAGLTMGTSGDFEPDTFVSNLIGEMQIYHREGAAVGYLCLLVNTRGLPA